MGAAGDQTRLPNKDSIPSLSDNDIFYVEEAISDGGGGFNYTSKKTTWLNIRQTIEETTGLSDGTVLAPALFFTSDIDTGLYKSADGTLAVTSNGVQSATFSPTGLTLTNDLAITEGGTGGSTASSARTNLGLAIGTNVQAWDAQLDDIAALAVTDGNFLVGNGANWVAENGATARTSLGLGALATLATVSATEIDTNAITTAKILDANVTAAKMAGGVLAGLISSQVFTTSGTWTKPADVTKVLVEVQAGGGGGGGVGSTSGNGFSGAGSGGGYTRELILSGLGSTETVTVGAGGAAGNSTGTSGTAGGTSSFGSFCSATGGLAGAGSTGTNNTGAYQIGGIGVGGTFNLSGGGVVPSGGGAAGGSSYFASSTGVLRGFGDIALAGVLYGGGGSGALNTGTSSSNGGVGAAGIVIVWEYK